VPPFFSYREIVMTPLEIIEYIKSRAGSEASVNLPYPMARFLTSAFEDATLLAGSFACLATSDRYQEMTVSEAVSELYANGMPVPEGSIGVLADSEDEEIPYY